MLFPIDKPAPRSASKRSTGRRLAAVCAGLGGLWLALQIVPGPARTNPPLFYDRTIGAQLRVPPNVARLLDLSCADCHSNRTRWPLYSHVAPFSWLIAGDVQKARQAMNFSDWPSESERGDPSAGIGLLAGACAAIDAGIMPPRRYLLLHPEARLSTTGRTAICEWTRSLVELSANRRR